MCFPLSFMCLQNLFFVISVYEHFFFPLFWLEIENQCNQCIYFVVAVVAVVAGFEIVLQYNLTRIVNYFMFFFSSFLVPQTHTLMIMMTIMELMMIATVFLVNIFICATLTICILCIDKELDIQIQTVIFFYEFSIKITRFQCRNNRTHRITIFIKSIKLYNTIQYNVMQKSM